MIHLTFSLVHLAIMAPHSFSMRGKPGKLFASHFIYPNVLLGRKLFVQFCIIWSGFMGDNISLMPKLYDFWTLTFSRLQ